MLAATITVTAAMDQTKVQTLVNRMNTLTGNLSLTRLQLLKRLLTT